MPESEALDDPPPVPLMVTRDYHPWAFFFDAEKGVLFTWAQTATAYRRPLYFIQDHFQSSTSEGYHYGERDSPSKPGLGFGAEDAVPTALIRDHFHIN